MAARAGVQTDVSALRAPGDYPPNATLPKESVRSRLSVKRPEPSTETTTLIIGHGFFESTVADCMRDWHYSCCGLCR